VRLAASIRHFKGADAEIKKAYRKTRYNIILTKSWRQIGEEEIQISR
jgi:hypothetical protein